MKRIKIMLVCLAILSGGALLAQENDKKEFKKKGDLIEATFYHDNGQIAQKGFYKDGKIHGEWIAYNSNGDKNAMGKYSEGLKIGKWFFWHEDVLTEVDYDDSKITSVQNWKIKDAIVSN